MRIKQIILRNNFKRFNDLTIDLGDNPPKIVALVGPNGSGKSSVLDGILALQHVFASIGKTGRKGFEYYNPEDKAYLSKMQENISILFDIGKYEVVFEEKKKLALERTIFSFRSPYRVSQELNIRELKAQNPIEENTSGASSTADLDERIVENYQRLYSYIQKYRKENDLTDKQAIERVLSELNKILIEVLDLEVVDIGEISDGNGQLYFEKETQVGRINFNVLSAGEKEIVDILLELFTKRDLYNDTVYLIDEPELHLNTAIQRKFLKALVSILDDKCQLWIATHSLGFLRAIKEDFKEDSAVLNFSNIDFRKKHVLRPMTNTRKDWKRLFSTALEDLSGLIAPTVIIYCEGRKEEGGEGEEQGLDAIVLNNIFEKEYPETLFISSGGATEPEIYAEVALKILGKAFDDVDLYILKDRDELTDEQALQWLNAVSIRKIFGRREIENYLYDLSVIQKVYPNVGIEKYNKLVRNIHKEDVKAQTGKLMTLCGVNTGMNKMEFKIDLSKHISNDMLVYVEMKESIFK